MPGAIQWRADFQTSASITRRAYHSLTAWESIGRFYADYLRLMNHFDTIQPGTVHHILNEQLIENPEYEVRQLLDYVGVDFDPACLDFHLTKRAIRTPSAEQVRRPLSREGVDHWRHYEPWLRPLMEALGDAAGDWDNV